MELKVTDEHRWLQKLAGDWKAESDEAVGGMWNETGTRVGDVFIQLDGQGDMPDGTPGRTLMTLGFDPERGKFVGSFAGSMMTHHWVYEGSLDEAKKVLTLDTEGPEWKNGRMRRFRDIIEFEDDDRRVLRSEMLGEDGSWQEVMRATFVRQD
jgi:hypothetical protein